MRVGDPFSLRTAVIAIEHRCHRIHAQPVDMVFLQPVNRIGNQEVGNLGAAVVIDQGVPILMEPLLWVRMFIEMRSVKLRQPMRIGRKMPGHPVEQNAQTCLMRRIDEIAEFMWRTKTGCRRIHSHRLVAPASIEREFRHRQELDMGKAHILHIGDQFLRRLFVRERASAVLPAPLPASQMHLIDGNGGCAAVGFSALPNPVGVLPAIAADISDHAGSFRRMLRTKAHRVGFLGQSLTMLADQIVFVALSVCCSGDKQLPDARTASGPHWMPTRVPMIEIPDNRDLLRVRRPDGKMRSIDLLYCCDMRPKRLPQP